VTEGGDKVKVRRIPPGVRALPLPVKDGETPRVAAESCGPGYKVSRHAHLDEMDGDTFK